MNTRSEIECYRVVYSTGGFFYTRARTAAEYMLDPIFIQFMVLSIFMFSALMLALEVPLVTQMLFFGAGVISTFFWMAILLVIYLMVIRSLNVTTIYTPVLLIPMQVMNAVMMEQVLSVFGTSYTYGFNNVWDISIRTVIIILCLDILHGKFVAPQHGMFAGSDAFPAGSPEPMGDALLTPPVTQTAPQYVATFPQPVQPVLRPVASPAPAPTQAAAVTEQFAPPVQPRTAPTPTPAPATDVPQKTEPPVADTVKIGNETFDLSKMRFIRSEDHYLLVQQDDQSTMVRGKLRDVSARIDVSWGIQINRSVWVAHAAITAVDETSSGPMEIKLVDGTNLRVSEARRVFFSHSYQQFRSA